MLKLLTFLSAVSVSVSAYAETASIADLLATTSDCLRWANKDGVPTAPLESAGWIRQADGVFTNPERISSISLPRDDDGVSRICVVLSEPLQKSAWKQLENELSKFLKSRPIKQTDSMIWMVNYKGNRGIQLFDKTGDGLPATRLIAAQF